MSTETELAKTKDEPLALNNTEIDEMFGNSALDATTGLSFNVVKIMRESAQFEVGPDEYEKVLTGHILFKHRANQWWRVSFDERSEEDSPVPNCYSVDAIKPCGGDDIQSDLCATCEQNKFGSGRDGVGKACRNSMRFLFLRDGAVLPVVIIAPPTSLSKKGSLQQWLNDVPNRVASAYSKLGIKNSKGGPVVDYWPAHVELSLEKMKFGSGMEASVLKVKTLDVLTPKDEAGASRLRQLFSLRKDTLDAYQNEIQAYVEREAGDDEPVGSPADDNDEIPV